MTDIYPQLRAARLAAAPPPNHALEPAPAPPPRPRARR